MASCSSVLGLVVILTTLALTAISDLTSYWVSSEDGKSHRGLWQECTNNCTWMKQTDIPEWQRVIRIVHAVSVANALMALFWSMGYLCCSGCRYSIRALQFIILVLVVGLIETVGVITVFAIKYKDASNNTEAHLDWSFYLGAASGGAFLLALFFFVCETSNAKRWEQYQPILPTSPTS